MRILTFLAVLILMGCNAEEATVQGVGYFDIEEYVSGLSDIDLQRETVQKSVMLNDKEESEEISQYIILPELNMMNKYNINKPALAGKYRESKEGEKIVYEALEEDLVTRKLSVEKLGSEVIRIEIEGLQKSILSESKQTIIFIPEKSFHLKSVDKNRYTKDITKEILIRY